MARTLFASGYGGRIHSLSFDPASRSLSSTSSVPAGSAPTWLTLSPTHPILYTGDEFSSPSGELSAFKITDDDTGSTATLSPSGDTATAKEGPVHFELSRDGKRLYAACYSSGAMSSVGLRDDGSFDREAKGQHFVFGGKGPNPDRQEGPHAHGVALDPTGEYLFCTDLGTDQLFVYKTGDRLAYVKAIQTTRGAGPRHLVFSKPSSGSEKTLLYLVEEMGNCVSIYEVIYPEGEVKEEPKLEEQTGPEPIAVDFAEPEATDVKPDVAADTKPILTGGDIKPDLGADAKLDLGGDVKPDVVPRPDPLVAEPVVDPGLFVNPVQLSISTLPPASSEAPGGWTAAGIELSPDGRFLYVSNRSPDEPKPLETDHMTVFGLNGEGLIDESEAVHVALGGRGPRHFMLSPQREGDEAGKYVAVAFQKTNEVAVFEVRGKELQEVARTGGLEGATCVVWRTLMSTFTLLVGGYEGKIHTVEFAPRASAPTLEIVSTLECGLAPTWLTLSPDGKKVYTLDEWAEPGDATALAVGERGQLSKLSKASTDGLWPCHSCIITPLTKPRLVSTNYKGASVSLIPLLSSGDVDSRPSAHELVRYSGSRKPGPHPDRQQQDHPHGAHVDPKGTIIVIPDLGTDDLRVLGIKEDGQVEPLAEIELNAGDGPRHVLFSKTGDRLYVINELDNSLSVLSVDYPASSASPRAGRYPSISRLQMNVSILPSNPMPHQVSFATWHCAELVLSPDGRFLYASNRAEAHDPLGGSREGPEDLVAIFEVRPDGTLDEATRKLVPCGGRAPRHLSLSSESVEYADKGVEDVDQGRWMAVSCHDSDELIVFERDGQELREKARLRDVGRPAVAVWL
ncbi:hypothetical protein JCM10212_007042 [Sporobolomyces blumeae]